MKEKLLLFIKGFIIGVANIIPGVSGGTLAITLGIYESLIGCVNGFFKNFKKNIIFLIPIGLGAFFAILLLSKVIKFALDKYPFATTLFFVGLIIGGVPLLFKKVRGYPLKKISNYFCLLIPLVGLVLLGFLSEGNKVVSLNINLIGILKLFGVGLVAAASMVIPGISGSFLLMILGYYKPIISVISELTNFNNLFTNILTLIPFAFGIIIGIFGIAKLLGYFLKKHEVKTYFTIIGFVLGSIITIIIPLFSSKISLWQILIGIILLIAGSICAYKLGDE